MDRGLDAAGLVRELSRSTSRLTPYNGEAVRSVMVQVDKLFLEASALAETALISAPNDAGVKAKLLVLQHLLNRYKRCLLAYHHGRLQMITQTASALPIVPESVRKTMSKPESRFLLQFNDALARVKEHYGGMIRLQGSHVPPKDLFIQVRVLRDCGSIQTEFGQILLSANTQHFLKRSDVQHLIEQGFLSHVK